MLLLLFHAGVGCGGACIVDGAVGAEVKCPEGGRPPGGRPGLGLAEAIEVIILDEGVEEDG